MPRPLLVAPRPLLVEPERLLLVRFDVFAGAEPRVAMLEGYGRGRAGPDGIRAT